MDVATLVLLFAGGCVAGGVSAVANITNWIVLTVYSFWKYG